MSTEFDIQLHHWYCLACTGGCCFRAPQWLWLATRSRSLRTRQWSYGRRRLDFQQQLCSEYVGVFYSSTGVSWGHRKMAHPFYIANAAGPGQGLGAMAPSFPNAFGNEFILNTGPWRNESVSVKRRPHSSHCEPAVVLRHGREVPLYAPLLPRIRPVVAKGVASYL